MKLLIGLGNPGTEYQNTPHNIGFKILDHLASDFALNKKLKAETTITRISGLKVILAKPATFMNNSGEAVRKIMDFYDLDLDDILVIHDDIDLVPGQIKIQHSASAAGHNGVDSIIKHIGSKDFYRLRFGVGRSEFDDPAVFVLKPMPKAMITEFDDIITDKVLPLIEDFYC